MGVNIKGFSNCLIDGEKFNTQRGGARFIFIIIVIRSIRNDSSRQIKDFFSLNKEVFFEKRNSFLFLFI